MSSASSPIEPHMPSRQSTGGSDDFADPSDPLYSRFKTWRSVIANLIEYFEQLESYQRTKSKECTKLSKTLEVPFKTPEFATDGISTIWQAARDKQIQMASFHTEEANLIKAGPIADLTRLRGDLKKHLSDLDREGLQGSKKVGKRMDKFSDQTQSLGKWIPVAETNPTGLEASNDPYVLWRQIRHMLYRFVDEENTLNEQLLQLQKRCQHYENLILRAIQKAIKYNTEQVNKESQYSLTIANELNAIAMQIPPDREWENFMNREPSLLKPDYKPRDPAAVQFPFSDHKLTKPVLEATLERKSTMLKRRTTSYYVLSPSGFLLEYKDQDPVTNPDPTLSLKLSDCELGNPPPKSGKAGFTIKGKDTGRAFGGRTHDYIFRTDSMGQAEQWWSAIEKYVGSAPRPGNGSADAEMTDSEEEDSPVSAKQFNAPAPAPGQTAAPETKTETGQGTGDVAQQHTTAAPQRTVSQKLPATATTAGHVHSTATDPPATAAPATTPAQSAASAATHTTPVNQSSA